MKKKILLLILSSIGTLGFAQTPQQISNINKTGVSTNPAGMTEFNNKLYFSADIEDNRGIELFEFDDSQPAGSKITRIDDIRSGANSSSPRDFHVFNNLLYFIAQGDNGRNIYTYSGTNDPEIALQGVANESDFVEYKNKLYFGGFRGELKAFTQAGTVETQTINASGGLFTDYLTIYNDTLYFIGSDGSNNGQAAIWKYDGVNAPTEVPNTATISGFNISSASHLHVFNDKLYFSYQASTSIGAELYSYDGSSVVNAADIHPGAQGSFPTHLTLFNNKLYFNARGTNDTNGDLYEYDGTNPPALVTGAPVNSSPFGFVEFDNKLYFNAQNELWAYDGTSASAIDINPEGSSNANSLVVFDNELYFNADNGINGLELMKYTGSGTPSVAEDPTSEDNASNPQEMIIFNDNLFFIASDGINGTSVWKYDGTSSILFADLSDISGMNSVPNSFAIYKDSLFISASDNLYRTDGISTPVAVLQTPTMTGFSQLTTVGNKLYLSAFESTTGQELYVYDGTSVSLVADLNLGSSSFSLEELIDVNGTLVFKNRFADELWNYSGTGSPTVLNPPSTQAFEDPRHFTIFNNTLFFTAETEESVFINGQVFTQTLRKLYSTNGVNQPSIVPLLDHVVGVGELGIYKNELVFAGEEVQFPQFVAYLYTYSGSNFKEIDLNGLSQEGEFTEVNDTLYCRAGNGAGSLWRYVTGGTPELVSAIPGVETNRLENLINFNDNLIFTADDGISGRELWGFADSPLGLNFFGTENEVSSTLNIYPNPTDGIIQTEEGNISLFDAAGNLAFSTYSEGIIDVSSLEAGLYIVHQNNKKTKLIIE